MMAFFGLNKILQSVRHSYAPALITACVVFYAAAYPIRDFSNSVFFHNCFLALSFIGLCFLGLMRQLKAFLMLTCIVGAYFLLAGLRARYGADYSKAAAYVALLFLLPLNILGIFWLPSSVENSGGFRGLCLLLGQGIVLENLTTDAFSAYMDMLWYAALIVWVVVLLSMLLQICKTPGFLSAGMFFALLILLISLHSAPLDAEVLNTAAVVILLIADICALVYEYFHDAPTGVYSRRSFLLHARKQRYFPLKYSLALIHLDDFSRLRKVFRKEELNIITRLVLNKVYQLPAKPKIYRLSADEFILIFENEDKKQSFQYLENVRRAIAGTEFVLRGHKPLKMTISASVSEKKRSDADATVVLIRAHDVLQKAYKFTQNITSQA